MDQKVTLFLSQVDKKTFYINNIPIMAYIKTRRQKKYRLLTELLDYIRSDKFFLYNKYYFILDSELESYKDLNFEDNEYIFTHLHVYDKLSILINFISYKYSITAIVPSKNLFYGITEIGCIFHVKPHENKILDRTQRYFYFGFINDAQLLYCPQYEYVKEYRPIYSYYEPTVSSYRGLFECITSNP